MRRFSIAAVLFVVGCGAPVGESMAPSFVPTPVPTQATPVPTATSTPQPSADVVGLSTFLLLPKRPDPDLLGYQIVTRVKNDGNGWAKLDASSSDFVVLDGSGGVTSTGSMSQAYPEYIAPGATGYLVTYDVQHGVHLADFVRAEVTPAFSSTSSAEVTFQISNAKVRYDDTYGLGGTGFVTASVDLDFAEVGVICLDSKGSVLGVANAQVEDLVAGVRKAFQTTGPPTEGQPGTCAKALFEAYGQDF
jgi:hypothetical protein